MFSAIIPFDNSNQENEIAVNPRSKAITPSQVMKLTAEGQATCMQALVGSTYYPNLPDDVMPLEFKRGVDINDTWEQSYLANEKINEYMKTKNAISTSLNPNPDE